MITPSFSLTATERVLPKLALDFTTASLDNRITFTRTTGASNPATYVNSSGAVTAATNNQPRFDYDPVALNCKGLLIEESRTNYLTYSNDFSQASWGKANASVSSSAAVSPDGTLDAFKLIEDSTSNTHLIYAGSASLTAGQSYSVSVYLKAAERTFASIGSVTGAAGTGVNLSTGALVDVGVSGWSNSAIRSSVNAGNGWWRVSITVSSATGGNALFDSLRVFTNNGSGTAYQGNGTSGIYVWGAQLEVGAFPTSYIPTTSTALTRNADVATMTGTNFSSWFNATQGSFELDFIQPVAYTGNTYIFACSGATNANQLSLLTESNPRALWYCNAGGSNVTAIAAGPIVLNATTKQVAGYKTDNYGMSVNGGTTQLDTSGAAPTGIDRLFFGNNVENTKPWSGWMRKVNYWPQRLTNNELQAFSK